MPDWQALADRIARQIMGWSSWNKLPREARQAHWVLMDEEPADWTLAYNRGKWWFLDESGRADWDDSIEDWQPHNDVAQAMLALRTLLTKIGRHATAKIAMRPSASLCHATIQNWVSTGGVPAMLVRSPHVDNETHAICLAIEACLNTQGMPDWASE